MKQFNKPNEELTDQELQELIMSDRTLASIVEPHTVIGQVYKRYYAKLATPQKEINLDEVENKLIERFFMGKETEMLVIHKNTLRNDIKIVLSDLSPSKPDQNG